MNEIRVLLADDHPMVRSGLRTLLEKIDRVVVEEEAETGLEVIERLKQATVNLLLLDLMMPKLNGLGVLEHVRKEFPTLRVIVVSAHANEGYVARAMKLGASGYLLKSSPIPEIEKVVHGAMAGEAFQAPFLSAQRLEACRESSKLPDDKDPRLSLRKQQVLQMIAEGQSSKGIAESLQISTKTVEMHRAALMKELQIHTIAGLTSYAIRNGIISP